MRYYHPVQDLPNDGTLWKAVETVIFGDAPLEGMRFDIPGYSMIMDGLAEAGLKEPGLADIILNSPDIEIGADVGVMNAEQKYDLILSMVFGPESMKRLSPETPGFLKLTQGLEERGIWSEDGQLAALGLPYGDELGGMKFALE